MSDAHTPAPTGEVRAVQPRTSNWNVPNVLTVLRIIAVPFFIVALVSGGTFGADDPTHRWLAWVIFILAMLTDWADGYLARSRNLITSFGKIADPIADKFLTGAAFIVLSALGELWWWVTIVILLREWGITVMRLFVIKYGVMAASKGGKIKTVLQTVALVLMLLPLGPDGRGHGDYRVDRPGVRARCLQPASHLVAEPGRAEAARSIDVDGGVAHAAPPNCTRGER